MIRKTAMALITTAGVWLLVSQWPDIKRYLKIRQMSQGDGHPENVPAGGSVRYSQP